MPLDVKAAPLQALMQGNSYGLELIDRVENTTKGSVVLLKGRVYPALRELESQGLLESYEGERPAERGGRPRVYYKLTAEGRRTAAQDKKALLGLLIPALGER
jgi:PadR family transcriptional regulator, regulatory protein PadR